MKNRVKQIQFLIFFKKKNEESGQTNPISCFFFKKNEEMGQKIQFLVFFKKSEESG